MRKNPFKPSAGVNPPLLVGREQVLADFEQGLFNGSGDPHRLLLVTGNRGAGKTVLLNALGEQAGRLKWLVIRETATSTQGICTNDQFQTIKHTITPPRISKIPGRPD